MAQVVGALPAVNIGCYPTRRLATSLRSPTGGVAGQQLIAVPCQDILQASQRSQAGDGERMVYSCEIAARCGAGLKRWIAFNRGYSAPDGRRWRERFASREVRSDSGY